MGNKKKLTQWQDKFWEHMVRKYPDLERGESASQTGRDHIPPRVFKEMTRLTKQKAKLEELLAGIGVFNAKSRAAEIAAFMDQYIPAVERMYNLMKKYQVAFTETTVENKKLKQENASAGAIPRESNPRKHFEATGRCQAAAGTTQMLLPCWIAFQKKFWMRIPVVVTGERSGLLSKIYDDPKYNAAF